MRILLSLLIITITTSSSSHDDDWKFLHAYPKHVMVRRVPDGSIEIDGNVNDTEWKEADWHDNNFEDITFHANQTNLNHVPLYQQASIAVLYDSKYLYVAATLKEPFTFANIPSSHNGDRVPYRDNDFEFFVDPSGSTEFYKEFEMNALNATYDVNWGVPDQAAGLHCSNNASFLPICTYLFLSRSRTQTTTTTTRTIIQVPTHPHHSMTVHGQCTTTSRNMTDFELLPSRQILVSSTRTTVNGVLKLRFRYETDRIMVAYWTARMDSSHWIDFMTLRDSIRVFMISANDPCTGVPILLEQYGYITHNQKNSNTKTLTRASHTGTSAKIFHRCRKLYVVSSE